jgi:hypothetical protein
METHAVECERLLGRRTVIAIVSRNDDFIGSYFSTT